MSLADVLAIILLASMEFDNSAAEDAEQLNRVTDFFFALWLLSCLTKS